MRRLVQTRSNFQTLTHTVYPGNDMNLKAVTISALVAICLFVITSWNGSAGENANEVSDTFHKNSETKVTMMPMSSSKSIFGGIQNALQIGMDYLKEHNVTEELQDEPENDPPPLVLKNVNSDCKDKGSFKFMVNEKERNCAWIGQNPGKRQKHCDKMKNGVLVKKKCKHSCDNCKNQDSSEEQKIEPAASAAVSDEACADLPGKHFPQQKEQKKRTCQKELDKKGEEKFLRLCTNKQYYKTNCPKTCNVCVECEDDSTFRFQFWSQERDCAWVSKSEKNSVACEKKASVRDNCRKTCDNCVTDAPTFSPTPLNFDPPQVCTDDSTFSLNGDTCSSFRGDDRQNGCQDDTVRRLCPTTVSFVGCIHIVLHRENNSNCSLLLLSTFR